MRNNNFDVTSRNYSKEYLNTINSRWGRNSEVMRYSDDIESCIFDLDKEDFIDSMLPFSNHPDWDSLDLDIKTKIRSCGWLLSREYHIYRDWLSYASMHIYYRIRSIRYYRFFNYLVYGRGYY